MLNVSLKKKKFCDSKWKERSNSSSMGNNYQSSGPWGNGAEQTTDHNAELKVGASAGPKH